MHHSKQTCLWDVEKECGLGNGRRIKANGEGHLGLDKCEGIATQCDLPEVCAVSGPS